MRKVYRILMLYSGEIMYWEGKIKRETKEYYQFEDSPNLRRQLKKRDFNRRLHGDDYSDFEIYTDNFEIGVNKLNEYIKWNVDFWTNKVNQFNEIQLDLEDLRCNGNDLRQSKFILKR